MDDEDWTASLSLFIAVGVDSSPPLLLSIWVHYFNRETKFSMHLHKNIIKIVHENFKIRLNKCFLSFKQPIILHESINEVLNILFRIYKQNN